MLVFSPYLCYLQINGFGFALQWIVSVLLGAVNIEQTKALHFPSLDIILGKTIKNLGLQRAMLKSKAVAGTIGQLLKLNMNLVGACNEKDFYYDPHSKHYTGIRKILKGWCSKAGRAAKAIYMDFIHTTKGFPVYTNIVDNYDDMRVRFFRDVKRLREIANFDPCKVLTFIVDRAIFSDDVFGQVIADPCLHLVTWEKDYKRDKWATGAKTGNGFISRKVNTYTGQRIIKYQYQDRIWDKNPSIRQLIVRVPGPDGKQIIEVSILTDDLCRQATQVIGLMLNRWVQENDFKYLIGHFGLDQVTSYQHADYEQIKDELEDKLYTSGVYKALCEEIESIRGKLKTVLYKLKLLRTKEKKLTRKQVQRKKELELLETELFKKLKIKEEERNNTGGKVSKIDELIALKKQKLLTNQKYLMDVIKITARNIFYLTFSPYREKYNNLRDDLFIFRQLSRSNGMLKYANDKLQIILAPQMEFPQKANWVIDELIQNLNETIPRLPMDEGAEIEVSMQETVDPMFAFSN